MSRAPYPKLGAFRQRMGWQVPWYSSGARPFNYDLHVTLDERVAPIEYNYRTPEEHERAGTSFYVRGDQPIELPGLSCFLRVADRVFHTYPAHARGAEAGTSNDLLDLTALGRQEPWEGAAHGARPPGRQPEAPLPGRVPARVRPRAARGRRTERRRR